MSRRYAQLHKGMFADPDVAALSSGAQLLYVKLLSEPTLSHAGVCGLTERRWANQSADTDRAGTEAALAELQAARFVLVDENTEEVLVRSWVRHSDMLTSPRRAPAVVSAIEAIASDALREAAQIETHRAVAEVSSDAAREVIANGVPRPCGYPFTTTEETVDQEPEEMVDPPPEETVGETVLFGSGSGSGSGSVVPGEPENQTPPTPPADAGGDERADAHADLTDTERALAEAFELRLPLPKAERRKLTTTATQLDDAGAIPDEIHRAVRIGRARFTTPLTLATLARHFSQLLALADDPNRPFDPEED